MDISTLVLQYAKMHCAFYISLISVFVQVNYRNAFKFSPRLRIKIVDDIALSLDVVFVVMFTFSTSVTATMLREYIACLLS